MLRPGKTRLYLDMTSIRIVPARPDDVPVILDLIRGARGVRAPV